MAMTLRQFLNGEYPSWEVISPETDWLEIAELELRGQLWIGDPYSVQRDQGFVTSLPPRVYRIEGKGLHDDDGYARVSRLRVLAGDSDDATIGSKIGEAGTDTATLGFCDIDAIESAHDHQLIRQIREQFFASASDGCGVIELPSARVVFSNTGYGDGTYSVVSLHHAKTVVGVQLRFIEL